MGSLFLSGLYLNSFSSVQFSSVQSSLLVVFNSLQLHELQHARPPCPSPTPRVHPDPCPSSRWCHPTISFSVIAFPFHLDLSQHQGLFQWVSSSRQVEIRQSSGASASVLPMNTQDWYPLGWTGWISLQSKGLPGVCSNTTVEKRQFFGSQLSL